MKDSLIPERKGFITVFAHPCKSSLLGNRERPADSPLAECRTLACPALRYQVGMAIERHWCQSLQLWAGSENYLHVPGPIAGNLLRLSFAQARLQLSFPATNPFPNGLNPPLMRREVSTGADMP